MNEMIMITVTCVRFETISGLFANFDIRVSYVTGVSFYLISY